MEEGGKHVEAPKASQEKQEDPQQEKKDLSDKEALIRFDNVRDRLEINVSVKIGEPLVISIAPDKNDANLNKRARQFVVSILDVDQELLSYGILERARQQVQNLTDARKITEFKEAQRKLQTRQMLKGGVANA